MKNRELKRWIGRFIVGLLLLSVLGACKPSLPLSTQTSPIPEKITTITTETTTVIQKSPTSTKEIPSIETPAILPTLSPTFPVMGIELYQVTTAGGVEMAQQAGAYWVRRNALLWSEVEPEPGVRQWEELVELEKEMVAASESGLQLVLVVRSTPDWAQAVKGSKCGPVAPDKLFDFASFMFDAVQRYSSPPYNVKYWELGNEPDISFFGFNPESEFGCWGDPDNPFYGGTYYAEMLKVVYPQVKAANNHVQVLVGGLLLDCDPNNPPETTPGSGQLKDCSPARFMEGILENGGGDYFDGVSFHAYDYYQGKIGQYSNTNWHSAWNTTGPVLIAKARYLFSLLARYQYMGKFLMNTELALLCGRDGSEAECQTADFENTKASYLAQASASAVVEQLQANIWYNLFGWRGSGLISVGQKPLPAYDAFSTSANFLLNVEYLGLIDQFPGVTGYEFRRGGALSWILWSLDGMDHPIQLDQLPARIIDVTGKIIQPIQRISITLSPIYIIW